ncbi:hypothetical protein ACEPAG_4270 [Sanghuangporus baumii]
MKTLIYSDLLILLMFFSSIYIVHTQRPPAKHALCPTYLFGGSIEYLALEAVDNRAIYDCSYKGAFCTLSFAFALKAVSSIPHIGAILAVTITIGVAIYEGVKNLEPRFAAEKKLGKDAEYIIRSIARHSQNLTANDPEHLQRLEEHIQELKDVAEKIKIHILETACARERHIRKFGPALSNVYDCVIETSTAFTLQSRLHEAKTKLLEEFQWIRMMEGYSATPAPPPYDPISKEGISEERMSTTSGPVRWVNEKEISVNPGLLGMMVPACCPEDSEDGTSWYIARVSYFGSHRKHTTVSRPTIFTDPACAIEPGKYKPGCGALFGHRREALRAIDRDIEVLIAEPGSVCWMSVRGRFTEDKSNQIGVVKGCCENDGTELAIARGWTREHMKFFTEKTIQPGKAGPKLECAYVIAGREEKKVKNYEVLVHANRFLDADGTSEEWMMVHENRISIIEPLRI